MRLELGKCYMVQLTGGRIVKFRFIGNATGNAQKVFVEADGASVELGAFLAAGYIAYWEVEC